MNTDVFCVRNAHIHQKLLYLLAVVPVDYDFLLLIFLLFLLVLVPLALVFLLPLSHQPSVCLKILTQNMPTFFQNFNIFL